MSIYQLLSCDVALAGDVLNVVSRHAFTPVTYPEMLVLRFIHGDSAITQIWDVGAVERDDDAEMQRLVGIYGHETVRVKMFPGAGVRLPPGDNRFVPAPVKVVEPQPIEPIEPVVLPAGSVDYRAQMMMPKEPAYVPSAEPVQDAGDAEDAGLFDAADAGKPAADPVDPVDHQSPPKPPSRSHQRAKP